MGLRLSHNILKNLIYFLNRASKRKKTTKSKETREEGDIQADSAGVEAGLGLRDIIGDDDEDVVGVENEDVVCESGDKFKEMINCLADDTSQTQLHAVITESPDGQISITWKVWGSSINDVTYYEAK